MSEQIEFYKSLKDHGKEVRKQARETETEKLKRVTDAWEELSPYHYRLFGGKLDIYPTSKKYHNLITKKRGRYQDLEEFILKFKETNEL